MTDRLIDVSWNENIDKKFTTNIRVYADKKENLLLDIITKSQGLNINILKVNTIYENDTIIYDLSINVEDIDKLNKYLASLKSISDIQDVIRNIK